MDHSYRKQDDLDHLQVEAPVWQDYDWLFTLYLRFYRSAKILLDNMPPAPFEI